MKEENCPVASLQEKYFLNTFPLINRIVLSKAGRIPSRFIEDLIQQVRYKLWNWKEKNKQNKDLSATEWQKLANVVTNNEITDYCRRKENRNVLFSEIAENENNGAEFPDPNSVEGNSRYEALSFLAALWDSFQLLSIRQKYIFLFSDNDFLELILKYNCCSSQEIATALYLSESEFVVLLGQFPYTEEKIQNLIIDKSGEKLTFEQIYSARSKAKTKLIKGLNQK